MRIQKIKNISELNITRVYFTLVFVISGVGIYLISRNHTQDGRAYSELILLSIASLFLVLQFIDRKLRPLFKAVKMINEVSKNNLNFESLHLFGEGNALKLLQNFNVQVCLRMSAEQRLARVSGLIKALNYIKQHSAGKNEKELFDLLCQGLLAFSDFTMVWIGKPEQASQRITPIASNGLGLSYLQTSYISARADIPEGCGPTGRAYREKIPVVVNDYQASVITKPWQSAIKEYGWQSAGAFPILYDNESYVVFTVYSPVLAFFENEVVDLLVDISWHIGSALTTSMEQSR